MQKVTKASLIAACAVAGMTKRACFNQLRAMVDGQIEPMVFKRNPTAAEKFQGITNRIVIPMDEQLIALQNQIGRTYNALGRSESADFDAPEIDPADNQPEAEDDPTPDEIPAEVIEDETDSEDDSEPEVIETPKPRAKGKDEVMSELHRFAAWMKRIREFCDARAAQTDPIDEIGNRPEWSAARLIPAGIPVEALIDVVTLTWPQDARNDLGIQKFDFAALSRKIGQNRGIDMSDKHEMFPYILTLCEEGIPVFLVGPQGSGKSTLCRQIADYLFPNDPSKYGETACSAGASRGDFYGRMTANQKRWFILSKFTEIHSNGGVFNFEEMDAALPEVLIALNNALAGADFFNSANGESYVKSKSLVPMATGNTWGTGANPLYVARERLDAATLDRWRMGRVFIPFDQRIADLILFGGTK